MFWFRHNSKSIKFAGFTDVYRNEGLYAADETADNSIFANLAEAELFNLK
jgi:hypothetical protein